MTKRSSSPNFNGCANVLFKRKYDYWRKTLAGLRGALRFCEIVKRRKAVDSAPYREFPIGVRTRFLHGRRRGRANENENSAKTLFRPVLVEVSHFVSAHRILLVVHLS